LEGRPRSAKKAAEKGEGVYGDFWPHVYNFLSTSCLARKRLGMDCISGNFECCSLLPCGEQYSQSSKPDLDLSHPVRWPPTQLCDEHNHLHANDKPQSHGFGLGHQQKRHPRIFLPRLGFFYYRKHGAELRRCQSFPNATHTHRRCIIRGDFRRSSKPIQPRSSSLYTTLPRCICLFPCNRCACRRSRATRWTPSAPDADS